MVRSGSRDHAPGTQRLTVGDRAYVGHSGLLSSETSLLLWDPRERTALAVIVKTDGHA